MMKDFGHLILKYVRFFKSRFPEDLLRFVVNANVASEALRDRVAENLSVKAKGVAEGRNCCQSCTSPSLEAEDITRLGVLFSETRMD